jgi:hypothetical protein
MMDCIWESISFSDKVVFIAQARKILCENVPCTLGIDFEVDSMQVLPSSHFPARMPQGTGGRQKQLRPRQSNQSHQQYDDDDEDRGQSSNNHADNGDGTGEPPKRKRGRPVGTFSKKKMRQFSFQRHPLKPGYSYADGGDYSSSEFNIPESPTDEAFDFLRDQEAEHPTNPRVGGKYQVNEASFPPVPDDAKVAKLAQRRASAVAAALGRKSISGMSASALAARQVRIKGRFASFNADASVISVASTGNDSNGTGGSGRRSSNNADSTSKVSQTGDSTGVGAMDTNRGGQLNGTTAATADESDEEANMPLDASTDLMWIPGMLSDYDVSKYLEDAYDVIRELKLERSKARYEQPDDVVLDGSLLHVKSKLEDTLLSLLHDW